MVANKTNGPITAVRYTFMFERLGGARGRGGCGLASTSSACFLRATSHGRRLCKHPRDCGTMACNQCFS